MFITVYVYVFICIYIYVFICIYIYIYLFIYLFICIAYLHIQCVRVHGCNIVVYVLRLFTDRLHIAYGQIYIHTYVHTHIYKILQVCPFINYEYLDVKGACFFLASSPKLLCFTTRFCLKLQ